MKKSLRKREKQRKELKSIVSWEPNILKRYVFFSELKDTNPSLYTHAKNYFSKGNLFKGGSGDDGDFSDEDYNDYIINYLKMLELLANKERENEIKYINTIKDKVGFPIEDYYTDNEFDYIKFIAALQLVHSDLDRIRSNISITKKNMQTISDKLENYKTETKDELDEAGKSAYDYLIEDYAFAYGNYIDAMNDMMSTQLEKSFSEQINEKVQEFFSTLSQNFEFIEKLRIFINKRAPEADIINEIQNWCVELLRDELMKIDNIDEIHFNPEKISDSRTQDILDRSLKATYSSVMTSVQTTVEKIIDTALNRNRNITNLLLEDGFKSLDELLDVINVDEETKKIVNQNFSTLQNNIYNTQNPIIKTGMEPPTEKQIKNKVASLKAQFTKKIGELIRQQLNQSRGLNRKTRKKIINNVISKYEKEIEQASKTAAEYIAKKIKVTNTSANSVAEILASPNFMKFLKENISNIFIPGKDIQYKADLTFNVHPPKIPIGKLKSIWDKKEIDNLTYVQDLAETQGKRFLTRYKELAHGATSVEKAEQAYKESIAKTLKYKQEALNSLDKNAQKLLNDYFNNNLDGAISVKEYHYYNNEKGYSMGSMGGDGRVVDAVPNILKMLELGGITGLDAEVIISALLNSFNDSIIGTSLLNDIKALLIGGAAMMLFDDGFANAEHFLEKMKEEFYLQPSETLPTGGSLHLLYLNNTYIPQSYVLFTIIDGIKEVYNDMLKSIKVKTKKIQRNSLELYNPIDNTDLAWIENNEKYPTPAEKWNYMSQYAQNEVKIHFLFMAGMLDILENLEKVFSNIK